MTQARETSGKWPRITGPMSRTTPALLGAYAVMIASLVACSEQNGMSTGGNEQRVRTARQALDSDAGSAALQDTNVTEHIYLAAAGFTECMAVPEMSKNEPLVTTNLSCGASSGSIAVTTTSSSMSIDASLSSGSLGGQEEVYLGFNVTRAGYVHIKMNPDWGCSRVSSMTVGRSILPSSCPAFNPEWDRNPVFVDSASFPVQPGDSWSIYWCTLGGKHLDSTGNVVWVNGDGSGHALTVTFSGCKTKNGAKEDNESCDGADLDGKSCTSLGFVGGTLACTDDCTFDMNGCTFDTSGSGGATGAGGSTSVGTVTGGAPGANGTGAGGTSATIGTDVGGTTGSGANGGASSGGTPGIAGASSDANDAGPQCSAAPTPLLSTYAPSYTVPTFKKGINVRGTGFDIELGGAVRTTGGTVDAPCHAEIAANAEYKSCVRAIGSSTCDTIGLAVAGACDFETKCTTPPAADCDVRKTTCCSGAVDASYTKSFPLSPRQFNLGPVSCDAALEFQVGSTVGLKREWGACQCDEGTFQATGSVFARDTAGFNGCSATLFGETFTFNPIDVNAAACVSLGMSGTQGCGSTLGPIGSAGVKFGITSNYKIGFLNFAPWELTSGGSVDAAGNLTTAVTCF